MRRLPSAIRGLVFDHLKFSDVLSATTTDLTSRLALGYIGKVFHVKDHVMSSGLMMDKLTLCEGLLIDSKDGLVWERVGWALRSMRHLRDVVVRFTELPVVASELGTRDETSWRRSCATLALSPELGRLRMLSIGGRCSYHGSFMCDEFKSLLLRLNPDCAFATAISCEPFFPVDIISELLRRGANPNAFLPQFFVSSGDDVHGIHPLELACATSRLEVVQLLLDNGATPPDRTGLGTTDTFAEAVFANSLDVLRLLYDSGHKSTMQSRTKGSNLLHVFSDVIHLDAATTISMVELICERQPELLTQYDMFGYTPLMRLTHQFVRDLFRKHDTPTDRLDLFKSLSKCMADYGASLQVHG